MLLPACNMHQEIKQAIEARKKSDSLLQEFNKVNEKLQKANESSRLNLNRSRRKTDRSSPMIQLTLTV